MVYDARRWAARSNVVIVTISYRLGPLGWLVQDGIPINLGIEDQRVALRFIRDHIALFGGDEKSITLFGQSVGATSIAAETSIAVVQKSPLRTTAGCEGGLHWMRQSYYQRAGDDVPGLQRR